VYQDPEAKTKITYRLSQGKITLDKWPFNVPKIEGYILGYRQDGYQNNLQPNILDFGVTQR